MTKIEGVLSSSIKGRHAELLAQTAFLANGYEVSEPVSPLPYDMIVRNPNTGEVSTVQVKTAFKRDEERYGGEWLVVRGAGNSGKTYPNEEDEIFAAIWEGHISLYVYTESLE